MTTTIAAGQLNLVVDGNTYVLMHGISMTLETESETRSLRGTHLTVAPVQTLYSWQSSKEYKLTISSEYTSQVFSDLIEFGITGRETKTTTVTGYKSVTTEPTGDTTVTLPAGAVAKTVLYSDIGMEAMVIDPANFDVTAPAAPVISNVLDKNVVVIYEIDITAPVAAENIDTQYKVNSLTYSASGKVKLASGGYEYIDIPAMSLATSPAQTFMNDGEVEASDLEFTVLNTTGTPYSRITLDAAAQAALGL